MAPGQWLIVCVNIRWGNRDTNKAHGLGRHSACVISVAFSPDSICIASGSYDRTVRVWDPRLRRSIDDDDDQPLEELSGRVRGMWMKKEAGNREERLRYVYKLCMVCAPRTTSGIVDVAQ